LFLLQVGDEPKSVGQQPLHHQADRIRHAARLNHHRVGRDRRVDVEPTGGDPRRPSLDVERLDLVGGLDELARRDVDRREES
jgi:hypothetical protein